MTVLALDLASRQSGWAIFKDEKLINYGIIKPLPLKLKAEERLQIIEREIESILDKYSPSLVILEQPAGGKEDNRGPASSWLTMSVLFMCHGVVRNIFEKRKIQYTLVSPSTWQNRLGFFKRDRTGRKDAAKKYAVDKYNLASDEEQDIYDSICLYDCWVYLETYKQNEETEESAF